MRTQELHRSWIQMSWIQIGWPYRWRRSLSTALLASMLLPGCVWLLDFDSNQCEVDADCTGRGDDFQGTVCREHLCIEAEEVTPPQSAWGCLGVDPPARPRTQVSLKFSLLPIVSGLSVERVRLRACSQTDLPCAGSLFDDSFTDIAGRGAIAVGSDLNGYVEASADENTVTSDIVTSLIMLDPAFEDREIELEIFRPESVDSFTGASFSSDFSERAIVVFNILDCNREPASGVAITIDEQDEQLQVGYARDNQFEQEETETGDSGQALATNVTSNFVEVDGVTTGIIEFHAEVLELEQTFGFSSALIRPGAITYVDMRPEFFATGLTRIED